MAPDYTKYKNIAFLLTIFFKKSLQQGGFSVSGRNSAGIDFSSIRNNVGSNNQRTPNNPLQNLLRNNQRNNNGNAANNNNIPANSQPITTSAPFQPPTNPNAPPLPTEITKLNATDFSIALRFKIPDGGEDVFTNFHVKIKKIQGASEDTITINRKDTETYRLEDGFLYGEMKDTLAYI